MNYVLDVLKERLNEKQAEDYYKNYIAEMDEEERRPYIENEMKYLRFFRGLFVLNNQELVVRINFICSSDIEEFFDDERERILLKK